MNIYVSNINFSTRSESFQNLFAEYGEVSSARIITDRETGRSRGFGFVEMPNDEEGDNAIAKLNGTEFEGKIINVSVARPREERGFGQSRNGYRREYNNRDYSSRDNNRDYNNRRDNRW